MILLCIPIIHNILCGHIICLRGYTYRAIHSILTPKCKYSKYEYSTDSILYGNDTKPRQHTVWNGRDGGYRARYLRYNDNRRWYVCVCLLLIRVSKRFCSMGEVRCQTSVNDFDLNNNCYSYDIINCYFKINYSEDRVVHMTKILLHKDILINYIYTNSI